jgi:hypothetical protein
VKGQAISYSEAELAFVKENFSMPKRELASLLRSRFHRTDITADHIKSLCFRRGWITLPKPWVAREDALLRRAYPRTPTIRIAEELGRSVPSTWHRARELGLKKDETYLSSPTAGRLQPGDDRGRVSRFQRGHAPANKGLRRPGWHRGRMKETQFKKGALGGRAAKVVKPIGAERISKDGYLERKINNDLPFQARWRGVHRIRWEEVNGPQPKGYALKSKDGNKLNTDPSNWELVPRALLPRLNNKYGRNYDGAPAELKPSIMAVAKLEHAMIEKDRRDGETTDQVWRRHRKQRKAS